MGVGVGVGAGAGAGAGVCGEHGQPHSRLPCLLACMHMHMHMHMHTCATRHTCPCTPTCTQAPTQEEEEEHIPIYTLSKTALPAAVSPCHPAPPRRTLFDYVTTQKKVGRSPLPLRPQAGWQGAAGQGPPSRAQLLRPSRVMTHDTHMHES